MSSTLVSRQCLWTRHGSLRCLANNKTGILRSVSSSSRRTCRVLRRSHRKSCKVFAIADSGSESVFAVALRKSSSLLYSRHDKDIFNLAIPALFSILLDPIMSLTDTGKFLKLSFNVWELRMPAVDVLYDTTVMSDYSFMWRRLKNRLAQTESGAYNECPSSIPCMSCTSKKIITTVIIDI